MKSRKYKKILIVAYGLSSAGGIGNALHNMIRMMYKISNDFELDLMLFDYDSRVIVQDLPIEIIKGEYKYKADVPIRELIKNIVKRKTPLVFLYHRILNKLYYRLSLMNDIANSIVPLEKEYDLAIAYNCIPNFITNYVANSVKATKKVAWSHTYICQQHRRHYGRESALHINGLKNYEKVLKCYSMIYTVSNRVKESILNEIDNDLSIDTFINFTNKDFLTKKSLESFDNPFSDKDVNLLTVGRLSFEKGIKLALCTAKLLKKSGYNFKWFFIGDLTEEKYVKKYVFKHHLCDDVLLLGKASNPYPYFKNCDIYVHTSYVEGYCTTTNEARMLGKPVVTTNVAGADEQIIDGINGFVVNHSVNDIFNAIKTLIESKELRGAFSNYNMNLTFDNKESLVKLKELLDF